MLMVNLKTSEFNRIASESGGFFMGFHVDSQAKRRRFFGELNIIPLYAAICLALFIFASHSDVSAAPLKNNHLIIAGSGTNLSITRLLAKAFMHIHPEIDIEIPESIGSSAAIQAVTHGAISIGLISRPLQDKEKNLGLTVLDYARTALVIGVFPSVSDDSITSQDLLNIYRGTKTRWKDGKEIIVLTREPGDSTIEVLMKEISGFSEVYEASQKTAMWSTLRKDQFMNQTLAKTPSAIGLSDLGTITIEHLAIKPLKFDGIIPSVPNIKSGKYKLVKSLSLVYKKDKLPVPAKLFIEFVQSSKADKIMAANGFVPGK